MVTRAEERTTLSVVEIGERLAPLLAGSGIRQAFLYGPYVRADRNGDLRRDDELGVLLVIDDDDPKQRKNSSLWLLNVFQEMRLYPDLSTISPSDIQRLNEDSLDPYHFMIWVSSDWDKIYG